MFTKNIVVSAVFVEEQSRPEEITALVRFQLAYADRVGIDTSFDLMADW